MACTPSEDSDQPGHPPSLIRVFAVRMKKARVLSYPLSAQWRLWSDWAEAQADLSLRWAHSHIVGFVMRRLIFILLDKLYFSHTNQDFLKAHHRSQYKNAASVFSQLFRRNKKLNFFFESGPFVLKSWTEMISKYAFNISCIVLSSNLMKFQGSSGFLSVFLLFSSAADGL